MPQNRRKEPSASHPIRLRWVIAGIVVLLAVWISFFDSHSLLKRVQWRLEYESLAAENERLRREIQIAKKRLETLDSKEMIEKIAREEYGMHRPNETVYRVKYE